MTTLTNDATRIYNLDETGLTLKPIKKKLLYEKGSKDTPRVVSSEEKLTHTVLVCSNAAGEYLLPYVLFKGTGRQLYHSWMAGAPEGTCFNVTPSGWMEDYAFEEWIIEVFLKFLLFVCLCTYLFAYLFVCHLIYHMLYNHWTLAYLDQ